jgi:hypothetical protein
MSEEETLRGKIDDSAIEKYMAVKDSKPTRRGEFIGVERDKFYVALSEEEVYELSPLAYYIWSLCDGEHTVRDIALDISNNANVPYHEVIEPLLIVLEQMGEAGLVSY